MSSNCRGTTAPAIEDEDAVGKRAARDQDGNVYYVPADMTYEEWWEKYVDNSRENVIMKLAKAHSISGILDTTPRIIDTTDYTFDEAHINRKRKHNVTREEAEQFIRDAEVSFTRWKGQFVCYIGSKGSTYIDVKNKNIRTSFKRNEYDENIMNFIKGVEKLNG